MTQQYYMRGYNTAAPGTVGYVDWVVNDAPDSTAAFVPSPYNPSHISNIVVNRVVTSKVNNFFNPTILPSFVSPNYTNPVDGYFLHLNSYDWLNPIPPNLTQTLPPPSQPIGLAVVRGTSDGTHLNPYSALFWSEGSQSWSFAQINANGTIGSSQTISMGSLIIDGYLGVQPTNSSPAIFSSTGLIRIANNQSDATGNTGAIKSRNHTSSGDISIAFTDNVDNVVIGDATHNVIIGGNAANTIGFPATSLTTVAGNLLVLGTSTTVESTVIDIVGRVIHANWSVVPNVAPPTQVVGYTVHRGAGATNQNDGAAIIWTEGTQTVTGSDGYWRFVTLPQDNDGYTITSSPNILNIMAAGLSVAATPNPVSTTLPAVGGLRTQTNTTAVSARNAAGTSDHLLLGTDNADHITLGATSSPHNAGFIFNTTTGSIYDFWVNSASQVQIGANAITFTGTDTSPTLSQALVSTASATGQTLTIQSQNATGTTSIGGNLNLTSGTGTSVDGYVNLQFGGTTVLTVSSTTLVTMSGTTFQFTSGVVAPTINQATTGSASGQALTLQAQNAATTGGGLTLTSGTGSSSANAGIVNIQTGTATRVSVNPTFTSFSDTTEALRVTPVSAGTTQITYAATVTAASINQTTTGSATGANMTLQAQNAATTGGNTVITSGTGTTAGNVQLQTGTVDRIIVHPTFTEYRDSAEAYRVTPVSAGTTTLQAASTVTAVIYKQADLTTNSGVGAATTVQAQNETGTTSTGGNLVLTSGTGTSTNGTVNLQVGGVTTASLVTNKFVTNKGRRRNVTPITANYPVVTSDDIIAVGTLSAGITVTLPSSPTTGDSYDIKDTVGGAATNSITVSGNGNNIDGAANFTINTNYGSVTVVFTGTVWSIL